MSKFSAALWAVIAVLAYGAQIRVNDDGSGSGAKNGLEIPPVYPLPPSPTHAPPSPSPFANVDFDSEPMGGSVIVPPPPLSKGSGASEGDGEGSGSGSEESDDPSGDGLPYEDPPMQLPPAKPTNMPLYHLRKDSFNPYCDTCKLVALSHDIDGGGEGCKLAPESRKEACEKMDKLFKRNMDSQMLLLGCIDKTGPVPMRCARDPHLKNLIYPEIKIYPDQCPAIVMCNIIEDESGGPLCGKVLRGWGDFLPEDKPHRASGRPTPWDTYPKAIQPPRIAPPPWLGVYPGNQYCDLCVDIMNQKQSNASADATYSCIRQPQSLMWKCIEVAKKMLSNPAVERVLSEGCVDRTGKEAVEKGGGSCPGLVACNLIDTPSGPMCGDMLEQYGDFKGGDSAAR